jgi:hypothetical protein
MSIENINAYEDHAFRDRFVLTDLYQRLQKDFGVITFVKNQPQCLPETPRQWLATPWFSAVPFYYIEFLTQRNPTKIYDIGCGWNIFKKYIPNIIGIGAEGPKSVHFHGDIHDYVDDDFVKGHQCFFESAFSINALHFHPLSDIQKIVNDYHSMLKPGATGWLSLNLMRMLERDRENFSGKSMADIDAYIRQELSSLNINFVVFDVDLTVPDDYIDGNIRLVMERPEYKACTT